MPGHILERSADPAADFRVRRVEIQIIDAQSLCGREHFPDMRFTARQALAAHADLADQQAGISQCPVIHSLTPPCSNINDGREGTHLRASLRSAYFSLPYSSSDTGSSHWLEPPSAGTSTARCENQLSFAAPCQCFTSGGIFTTSPGKSSLAGCPHSW